MIQRPCKQRRNLTSVCPSFLSLSHKSNLVLIYKTKLKFWWPNQFVALQGNLHVWLWFCFFSLIKYSIYFMPGFEERRAYWFAAVSLTVCWSTNSLRSFSLQKFHILKWNSVNRCIIIIISRTISILGMIKQFLNLRGCTWYGEKIWYTDLL